jgi:hypothetical protein
MDILRNPVIVAMNNGTSASPAAISSTARILIDPSVKAGQPCNSDPNGAANVYNGAVADALPIGDDIKPFLDGTPNWNHCAWQQTPRFSQRQVNASKFETQLYRDVANI